MTVHLRKEILESLCVFDIDAADLDRYAIYFLGLNIPPKLMLIDDPKEYIKYRNSGKFKSDNVKCSAWLSIKEISSLFLKYQIKNLVIDAHRIPDVHIIIAAKRTNTKVIYLQHGMYIPFMKRVNTHFIRNIIKTFRYLYYAINISIALKKSSIAINLFLIHVQGKNRSCLSQYHNIIYPDISGVYSEYWLDWHINNYAFPKNTLFIMGTPDLNKHTFTEVLSKNDVAYCYQTLLEDGRIPKKIMFKFYSDLYFWAKKNKKKIVIKSHPLANTEILNKITKEFGFQVESTRVPNTQLVIGHYSSLLPYWGLHKRKVVCVKLKGHEIDHSISAWSYVIDDILNLDLNDISMPNENLCSRYFSIPVSTGKLFKTIFK